MSATRQASFLHLETDGGTLLLVMGLGDDRVVIPLGAAEALTLASELLTAARARLGRADWPPVVPAPTTVPPEVA
jgi:hypothetical protein